MQNLELQNSKQKMMSSKLIALKTGKEHKNVLKDIRNILEKGESSFNPFDYQIVKRLDNGFTNEILLNERLSLILAAGYSIKLRIIIIDEWIELKKEKEQFIIDNPSYLIKDPIERAKAWIEEEKQRTLLLEENSDNKKVIEIQKPKAEFYDLVIDADGTFDFGEGSKLLKFGYGRNKLFAKLKEANVLMWDNEPYQQYIEQGFFIVVELRIIQGANGITKVIKQTRITQKGLDWLIKNKNKFNLI